MCLSQFASAQLKRAGAGAVNVALAHSVTRRRYAAWVHSVGIQRWYAA